MRDTYDLEARLLAVELANLNNGTVARPDDEVPDPAVDSEATWLGLILDHAPLSAFEDLRARLSRQDVASMSDGPSVDDEARRALQLRAMLTESVRHAAELSALNDLSSRLTTLRDSRALLVEVARQARQLLGVDIAYIMLVDPNGLLRVNVVDGSIGTALEGLTLQSGVGIGGRVLETGEFFRTADYLSEYGVDPGSESAQPVLREQLGGILAVPLLLDDAVIGALFAADRRPHVFSESEVRLLSSLASHAAIAINNARLFESTEQARTELEESRNALRRAAQLHDALTELVARGAGPDEVLAELVRAIACDITLLDPQGATICSSTHGEGTAEAWSRRRETLQRDVMVGETVFGRLLIESAHPLSDDAMRIVETGTTVVALAMAVDRAVSESERRAEGELIAAIVEGGHDEREIARRARRLGIDVAAVSAVAVIDPEPDRPQGARSVALHLRAALNGCVGERAGQQVVLVSGPTADEVVDSVGGSPTANVGVAPVSGVVDGVAAAFRQARSAVQLLAALGRANVAVKSSDLGIYRALLSEATREDLLAFVEATIGPLLAYDADRGRNLTRTLEVYIDVGRNHAEACRVLHIHPNTLYQRLDRITQCIGETWRDPDLGFEVQLALRIHRLASA